MKVFVKVMWVIAGIALIIGGVSAFFNPISAFLMWEYILGGAFVVSGLAGILAYFASRNVMLGAGWVLADGILSIIFGGMIIFGKYSEGFLAITVSAIVGIWLIISGVNNLSRSFDMHRLGAKGWGWLTFWGLICIIGGVLVFCNPLVSAVGIVSGLLIGLPLIVGGVAMLFRCLTTDIET